MLASPAGKETGKAHASAPGKNSSKGDAHVHNAQVKGALLALTADLLELRGRGEAGEAQGSRVGVSACKCGTSQAGKSRTFARMRV